MSPHVWHLAFLERDLTKDSRYALHTDLNAVLHEGVDVHQP